MQCSGVRMSGDRLPVFWKMENVNFIVGGRDGRMGYGMVDMQWYHPARWNINGW